MPLPFEQPRGLRFPMTSISNDVFYEVLGALFDQWLLTETPSQIREDEDKVSLLLKIRDEVVTAPPKHIAEFHSGVFRHDYWNNQRSG